MSGLIEGKWSTYPFGSGVSVVTSDANGLGALNKPAGILSHPNEAGDEKWSLLHASYDLEQECYHWTADGAMRRLWLLNRLDAATSGVILVADNEPLATEIRAQFKRKQVRKTYLALVFGTPRSSTEIWRDLLAIDKRGGHIRATALKGNVPAECRMTVLRRGQKQPRVALLKLEPRTGRSHQLRVQCAKRNLPIVGDQNYGDFGSNREFAKATKEKRMFLHSCETRFTYTWKGRTCDFVAQVMPSLFEIHCK